MDKIWEYWVFDSHGGPKEDDNLLYSAGKDGWELVSVIMEDYDTRRFFLKRRVLDTGWPKPL